MTHACLPNSLQVEILGSKGVVLNMTASWLTMDDERKYNKEAVEALLRGRLLALTELDSHLAKVQGHFYPIACCYCNWEGGVSC